MLFEFGQVFGQIVDQMTWPNNTIWPTETWPSFTWPIGQTPSGLVGTLQSTILDIH